jgi:hypothetical protein
MSLSTSSFKGTGEQRSLGALEARLLHSILPNADVV